MLNEAVACLHDGVVADADLLDAGVIFGTGFAPFRGGPLHYKTTHPEAVSALSPRAAAE
jgi:3-hydroxyacyl-CoA dehydrogenase/enoyl-CoA hydratase/3-hydroxybutyryl-CoA epimerase